MIDKPFDYLPNAEYLVILGVGIFVALTVDLLAAFVRRILERPTAVTQRQTPQASLSRPGNL